MELNFGSRTKAYRDNIKFTIDSDDYDKFCKDYSFKLNKGYVLYSSTKDRRHNKSLHRLIMNVSDSKIQVDHIDNNPLNNQKSNLRTCTNQQNQCNKTKTKLNSSGFKGVYFDKVKTKYRSRIMVNCKQIHLGYFATAEEAYEEYKKAAIKYHGEFACF